MSKLHSLTWTDQSTAASPANEQHQTLIERCLKGEERAFQALYNQNSGMVYRLAFGLLQNKEDAEEVLQDSFDYAFRKIANYDPNKSAFKTWLYRITVSRCRNKRRRKWLPTFTLNAFTIYGNNGAAQAALCPFLRPADTCLHSALPSYSLFLPSTLEA